jgi:putative transcriptional regulator
MVGGEKMSNNIAKYVERLKSKGITTTEIIEKSGVGRTTFYDIMRGKQIPKIDTAMAISKALQADIKDVFPQLKGERLNAKDD